MKELLWWEESGPGFLAPPPSPLPTPSFSNSIMFPILLLFSQWLWLDTMALGQASPQTGASDAFCIPCKPLTGFLSTCIRLNDANPSENLNLNSVS